GIGNATIQTLVQAGRAAGIPLTEAALRLVSTDELKPKTRTSLRRLMEDFDRWRAMVEQMPHPELAGVVLDESGYTAMWQADKGPEAQGRLDNLKELVAAMEEFETLGGFLEHVSLVMENDAAVGDDKLTLMTLHAAKGLEFGHVFLPGWEEGLFPHQRAMDESGIAGLEEERRLAYVGLTRARDRAYVSSAANRLVHGQWQSALPSRFVGELPGAHTDHDSDPGLTPVAVVAEPTYAPAFRASYAAVSRRGPARTIDGAAWEVASRPRPQSAFSVGDRVFHQKFGYGEVRAVDEDKLVIDFEHAGEKRVIDSFVQPAGNG
ncbi:MAG: ATP-binding domain-containing protein, partial [Rhodospirillaceae bacterium]|nr:ATP-binding domain-containing protein [Rhodospirillaceae bacterium]